MIVYIIVVKMEYVLMVLNLIDADVIEDIMVICVNIKKIIATLIHVKMVHHVQVKMIVMIVVVYLDGKVKIVKKTSMIVNQILVYMVLA